MTTDEIDKAVHKMIVDNGAYPSPLTYGKDPSCCLIQCEALKMSDTTAIHRTWPEFFIPRLTRKPQKQLLVMQGNSPRACAPLSMSVFAMAFQTLGGW